MVFEKKVLTKIFGPTKGRDGTWRIKTNYELDKLIRQKNIINYINYIKAQTLSWFCHLHWDNEIIPMKFGFLKEIVKKIVNGI